jgi:hypothetical protein
MDTSHTIFPLGKTLSSGSPPQFPIKVTEFANVESHSTVAGGAVLCCCCISDDMFGCAYDAKVLIIVPLLVVACLLLFLKTIAGVLGANLRDDIILVVIIAFRWS